MNKKKNNFNKGEDEVKHLFRDDERRKENG